jgi:predicted nucleic acid-binding protein
MIILDTNVISEPMRPAPDPAVIAWLDSQVAETLFITSISIAELMDGIEFLPEGKRKYDLGTRFNDLMSRLFAHRILPFDEHAAQTYAKVARQARSHGVEIAFADGQIAAIAATHGFAVATRDVTPFTAAEVTVINPWRA